ncbi:MAG TPA: PIN domain-containing protein [Actinomycetota bacterium]
MLVVDTSVLLASLDVRERHHARCRDLLLGTDERIAVPTPTLCELDHLVHRSFGPSAMPGFLERVRDGELDMVDLEPGDLDRTVDLMQRYVDLDVGFVDAAILAIVERLDEPKLATLDRKHFGVMRPRHVDALELLPR